MASTPIRWAAGLALLAAVAAGCSAHHPAGGTANPTRAPATHSASTAPKPPAPPPATHHRATAPPAPAPTTVRPTTPPPKRPGDNGGDHDADNNGGPDDGDGNI